MGFYSLITFCECVASTCTCVCLPLCVSACPSVCMCMSVCVSVCVYACLCVCVFVFCVCLCVHVCASVCLCVHLCVSMCVSVYVCVNINYLPLFLFILFLRQGLSLSLKLTIYLRNLPGPPPRIGIPMCSLESSFACRHWDASPGAHAHTTSSLLTEPSAQPLSLTFYITSLLHLVQE